MAALKALADELHKNPKYYNTVVVDSLTELQQIDMREVMQDQYNKKPETTDIYVPSPREWGKSGSRVKEIVRYLRDLPNHTIVTALLREEKDEKTGIVKLVPDVPGQLKAQVPGFFDIVGLMQAVENNGTIIRTLQFAKTRRVIAKDRTSTLPDLFEEPSIPAMWDYIRSRNGSVDRDVTSALQAAARNTPSPSPNTEKGNK